MGIVFYQLLGGYLPYDETAWLDKRAKVLYDAESDQWEKCKIANESLSRKITTGRVLSLESLPCFVPPQLIRLIKAATALNPSKRIGVSEFVGKLFKLKSQCSNWEFEDGYLTLNSYPAFRCVPQGGQVVVEKRKNSDWRKDGRFQGGSLKDAVAFVRGLAS